MSEERFQLPAEEFKGPPNYPHLYPGQRPPGSYLLSSDKGGKPTVYNLYDVDLKNLGNARVSVDGEEIKLNDFLTSRKRLPVEYRIPFLAYGSNVCPMQLVDRKFGVLKHEDSLPNIDVVALKGKMLGYSVVYAPRVTSYAPVVPANVTPSEGETEAWVVFLDSEQLFRMHETEGVKRDGKGVYRVGIQHFKETETGLVAPVYGYIGGKIYIERSSGLPVRFAGRDYRGQNGNLVSNRDFVPIDGGDKNFPERAEIEMMELYNKLVLDEFGFSLFEWVELTNFGRVPRYTETSKTNLSRINEYLAQYGRDFSADVEFVEEPFEIESFKRLEDII